MKKKANQIAVTTMFLFVCFICISCGKKPVNNSPQPTPVVTQVSPLKSDVAMWLTNADRSATFQEQNIALDFAAGSNSNTTINVDTTTTYQSIDGFGFCLTGGSASLINALGASQQNALLRELFLTDSAHIGISYLRISIGASDLSASDFTYDDVPTGQTDVNLTNFSISPELTDLVPVLKKIIAINPTIKILATPWTAPVWMKINSTGNNGFTAGSLNTAYYDTYATYFVKYIQAMQAQGITIDAITPQNEPLNPNNNPAMVMQPAEEDNFI